MIFDYSNTFGYYIETLILTDYQMDEPLDFIAIYDAKFEIDLKIRHLNAFNNRKSLKSIIYMHSKYSAWFFSFVLERIKLSESFNFTMILVYVKISDWTGAG